MIVWRLAKPDLALKLDGETSRAEGGRWHSPGRGVVTTARALSTLVLETMAMLPGNLRFDLPLLAAVALEISDETSIRRVTRDELGESPGPSELRRRAIGDAWLKDGIIPVLEVPSDMVPQDTLILLDPLHEAFGRNQIRVVAVEPFALQPQLYVKSKAPLLPRPPR